ncbi:hypothetical protein DYB37_004130 [Aphanomyces astaci]|uniref:Uncharacterized protein n=1 Tax=Aphanomyces astaci TaxID=112090 RepID=A0A397B6T4_APHAT|nr:hypothetical protein DYB36_004383 [Aphanomyces astaci]RHY89669.1 hypothetical protein DYB35_004830 [Aphanomyces astaci]RHZ18324.1 hypothetical protein DYB37_004130 [Aphanomyces astaci]RQM20566.1 hypothetical protein B5M09_010425 [Aphanomyces astaci]
MGTSASKQLFDSAGSNDVVKLRSLIKEGIDVNMTAGPEGITALHAAAEKGHQRTVALLLENGAEVDRKTADRCTPLYYAAKKGHVEVAQFLIDSTAALEASSIDGTTPLMIAAQKGRPVMVEVLIDRGANVEACRKLGITPLAVAAIEGHLEVVKHLLANAHASFTSTNQDGSTQIVNAAAQTYSDVADAIAELENPDKQLTMDKVKKAFMF